MTTEISSADGKVHVMVNDPEFAAKLSEIFGSRIFAGIGESVLLGRETDDEPHYGGARIWQGSDDGEPWPVVWCSTGLKMQDAGSGLCQHVHDDRRTLRGGYNELAFRRYAGPFEDGQLLTSMHQISLDLIRQGGLTRLRALHAALTG